VPPWKDLPGPPCLIVELSIPVLEFGVAGLGSLLVLPHAAELAQQPFAGATIVPTEFLRGPGTGVETRTERGVFDGLELGRFRLFLKPPAKPKSGNFGIGPRGVLGERLHHPVHRRVLPVFHLDPVLRPTSLIGPVPALRDQTLQTHVAGGAE
jgi:hypothetical protein